MTLSSPSIIQENLIIVKIKLQENLNFFLFALTASRKTYIIAER